MSIPKNYICFLILFIIAVCPINAFSMAGFGEWEIAAPGGYFIGCNDKVPEECLTLYDQNYNAILSDIEDYKFFNNAIAGSFTNFKANSKRYFIFQTNTGVLHLYAQYDELLLGLKEHSLYESVLLKTILLSGAFGMLPIIFMYYLNNEEKKLVWYRYFSELEYNLANSIVASLAILLTYLLFSTGGLFALPDIFAIVRFVFKLISFFIAFFISLPILKFIIFIFAKLFKRIPSKINNKACAILVLISYICILNIAGQLIIKKSPYFYRISNLTE